MAIGDYILCCKCEVKLIYDGDRGQREWWEERFGKEPEIECPDCKPQRKPLTDEELKPLMQKALVYYGYNPDNWHLSTGAGFFAFARAIEAAHGIKE